MKVKIYSLFFVLASVFVFTSCEKYDDSIISQKVDSLSDRVMKLENSIDKINRDIGSLQTLVLAYQQGLQISNVRETEEGVVISFTNGTSVAVKNGKDGRDGSDGKDGVNGSDGKDAPVIGVGLLDGVHYWTITQNGKTTFLTDEYGQYLPLYTFSNNVGTGNGRDGVTPIIQVDKDGFWMVSYDNGKTFKYVYDTTGNKVLAVGQDGQNGADGKDGATPIIGVKLFNGRYVWTITVGGVTTYVKDEKGNYVYLSEGNSSQSIVPILSVSKEGYWIVSYDNGVTYNIIRDTNGNPVFASNEGKVGDSVISDYTTEDDYIVLHLVNGTVLYFEKYKEFSIMFDKHVGVIAETDNTCVFTYSITGANSSTFVEVIEKGNVTATVKPYSIVKGEIVATLTGEITEDTRLLVLLCDDRHTVTKVLTFSHRDDRLYNVIPEEILDKMGPYVDVYQGNNPPSVEGAYFIDPFVCVYCEDYGNGGYAPGDLVTSEEFRFFDQDFKNNTICFEGYEGSSHAVGDGAFISGYDNNFTIFLNNTGVSSGIKNKTAVLISGQMTPNGIRNLKYAFVMVEKDYDPGHVLMSEGVFRVFKDKDGLSVPITWSHVKGEFCESKPEQQNLPMIYSNTKK